MFSSGSEEARCTEQAYRGQHLRLVAALGEDAPVALERLEYPQSAGAALEFDDGENVAVVIQLEARLAQPVWANSGPSEYTSATCSPAGSTYSGCGDNARWRSSVQARSLFHRTYVFYTTNV